MRSVVLCLIAAACGRINFQLDDSGSGETSGDGVQLGDGNRPDIMFDANVVFVTGAVATPGMFDGFAAADAICQDAADRAALPGTYVAWLSTTSTNAIARLTGSRGWVRTDGTPFADQPSDIASGVVWSPISLAADGSEQAFADPTVVTGTLASGIVSTNCADWTATAGASAVVGRLTAVDNTWTSSGSLASACAGPSRLYCFGTGKQVVVTPPAVTGRRAFYARPVSIGGGVAALDTRCQMAADGAGLGGTFRAFVATSTASAISRFDTSKAPWSRIDGVPLAPTASDVAVGLRAPLNTYADGTYYAVPFGAAKAWTGANDPSSVGAPVDSCTDWTSTSPSEGGFYGQPTVAGASAFHDGAGGRRCDETSYGVYCLEL